jgi:hypothetical protein
MTKQEAIEQMKKGVKVTHRFFSQKEWITMQGNLFIITEEGYRCPAEEFWFYRTSIQWETDWEVFGE